MLQDLLIFYGLMLWDLVIGTLMLIGFWFALGRGRGLNVLVVVISSLFIVAAPVMYILYLVTLVTLSVLWRTAELRPRWFVPVSAMAMLLIQAYFAAPYVRRFHELEALRDSHPSVSLADRLAYESRSSGTKASTQAAELDGASGGPSRPAADVKLELEWIENRLDQYEYEERQHEGSLRALSYFSDPTSIHARVALEFYLADGFGVIRARVFDLNSAAFAVPDLPDLKLPKGPEPEFESSAEAKLQQGKAPKVTPPDHRALREVHEAGAFDFVNRNGFGYVAGPDQVFGFRSHGFRAEPKLKEGEDGPSEWRITTLQLVSLLKHEAPVAYLSDSLPRMDKLVDVPIRSLDDFEAAALQKLRAGEQVVIEPGGDEIRMLGSLRAARQCLQCHSVERGHLLGAFSYRIRRSSAGRPGEAERQPLL